MSEWIAVCGEEGDNPIEVETEDGKSIIPPPLQWFIKGGGIGKKYPTEPLPLRLKSFLYIWNV